jgi:gluconokinase
LIKDVYKRSGISLTKIKKISFTSQSNTFSILNPSGKPMIPFISWMDERAVEESQIIAEKLGKDFHLHSGYAEPLPSLQITKLYWIRRHNSELLSPQNKIVSVPSFLSLKIAGINSIDFNLAGMSGLYSFTDLDWWDQAIDICQINKKQLPLLTNIRTGVKASTINKEIDFSDEVEIFFSGNDQSAGAVGNACSSDKMIVTLGTALVAYRYMGNKPGPYSKNSIWGRFPLGGYFELGGGADNGCAALDWAIGQLMPGSNIHDFETRAKNAYLDRIRSENSLNEIFFYPDFAGTRRAWSGVGNLDWFVLSVFEGILFTLRKLILEDMQVKRPLPKILAAGGGSKSNFWLQMMSDILDANVSRATGDALLGAAIMASKTNIPEFIDKQHWILPDQARVEIYEKLYWNWRKRLHGNAKN